MTPKEHHDLVKDTPVVLSVNFYHYGHLKIPALKKDIEDCLGFVARSIQALTQDISDSKFIESTKPLFNHILPSYAIAIPFWVRKPSRSLLVTMLYEMRANKYGPLGFKFNARTSSANLPF